MTNVIRRQRKTLTLVLIFIFFSFLFGVIGIFSVYSIIALIKSPHQYFGFTSTKYENIAWLEGGGAIIVAFLYLKTKYSHKKLPLKSNNDRVIRNNRLTKIKYFLYNVGVLFLFFGLINFGELTQFSEERLNIELIQLSWPWGLVIGIIVTLIIYKEKTKKALH